MFFYVFLFTIDFAAASAITRFFNGILGFDIKAVAILTFFAGQRIAGSARVRALMSAPEGGTTDFSAPSAILSTFI